MAFQYRSSSASLSSFRFLVKDSTETFTRVEYSSFFCAHIPVYSFMVIVVFVVMLQNICLMIIVILSTQLFYYQMKPFKYIILLFYSLIFAYRSRILY